MSVGASGMTVGISRTLTGQPAATVNAAYLRGVLDYAATRGARRSQVLARSGIAARTLDDDATRVPVECAITCMRAAASLADDPAFMLHFGVTVACGELTLASPMAAAAETVVDALAALNRFSALGFDFPALGDAPRFSFRTEGGALWFTDERPADDWPEITESVLARIATGMRRVAGRPVVRAVHVRHPRPSHAAAYTAVFGVPVQFGSALNALVLDPAFHATRLQPAPSLVTRTLSATAEAQREALLARRSWRGRVAAVVHDQLPTRGVTVDAVARTLAVSRQTLYRRLREEGTTFDQVLLEVRRTMALAALARPGTTVRQAAVLTGFSDAASFSRAFKRWTGRSPSDGR
jgi:AraC-like DNA-binding protein